MYTEERKERRESLEETETESRRKSSGGTNTTGVGNANLDFEIQTEVMNGTSIERVPKELSMIGKRKK